MGVVISVFAYDVNHDINSVSHHALRKFYMQTGGPNMIRLSD